ncbi:MAG: amidase [Bacillota bacterium]
MYNDTVFMTMTEKGQQIKAGRIFSKQAVENVLKHIREYNKHINAIVTIDEERAINQAEEADRQLNGGETSGLLQGVPITIKDFFKTAGMRSTASHEEYKDNIPEEDATVVKRLKDSGTIILGKTNLPEMAMDCQTVSPLFGRTNNPWKLDCTSGGSSGGGAAAVASGMSYLDIGNDLMGSVRIPASFCGIYGFVPTERLVPNTGLLVEKPQYGTLGRMMRPGIMARSIEDIRIALEIISGPDYVEADGIALNRLSTDTTKQKSLSIAWSGDAGGLAICEDTCNAFKNFIDRLENDGCNVKGIDATDFNFATAREVFLRIFYPVIGSYIPFIKRLLARTFGKAKYLDLDLKKYLEAENMRSELISQLDRLFNNYDVLLCPVTATPSFPHIKPDGYAGRTPIYKKGINVDGKL